jgi:hypothetical protein
MFRLGSFEIRLELGLLQHQGDHHGYGLMTCRARSMMGLGVA